MVSFYIYEQQIVFISYIYEKQKVFTLCNLWEANYMYFIFQW